MTISPEEHRNLDAVAQAEAIRSGLLSSTEAVDAALATQERAQPPGLISGQALPNQLADFLGLPAMSVPPGRAVEGRLPCGLQLMGAGGNEPLLLRRAAEPEQIRPWAMRVLQKVFVGEAGRSMGSLPREGGGGGNKVRPNGRTTAGAGRALRGPGWVGVGRAAEGRARPPAAASPSIPPPSRGEASNCKHRNTQQGFCDTLP